MSFCIHNVKVVDERWNRDEVNKLLGEGWVLLAAGFDGDKSESNKTYILGNIEIPESPRSALTQFLEENS